MNTFDIAKSASFAACLAVLIYLLFGYSHGYITLPVMLIILIVSGVICILFPHIAMLILDLQETVEDKMHQRKEKRNFRRLMNENPNVCCNGDINMEKFEQLRGLRPNYNEDVKIEPVFDLGPQLTDYLLNYGRIETEQVKLCGSHIGVNDEFDMLTQSQILHSNSPRTIHDLVLEKLQDGKYVLVDSYYDFVHLYDSVKDEYLSSLHEKIRLYDYIQMRLEGKTIELNHSKF